MKIILLFILISNSVGIKGILSNGCLRLYINQQEYQGKGQSDVQTEQECFDRCRKTANCGSFEWIPGNVGEKCFIFQSSDPPSYMNRTGVFHYTFNCQCSWVEYLNQRNYGGMEVSAPTFTKCGEDCLKSLTCEALEWDTSANKCYFFDNSDLPKEPANGINHYIWKCKPKTVVSKTTQSALVVQVTQAPDCFWSYVDNKNFLYGTQILFGNTLKRCKEECVMRERCKYGFDWRPTASPSERCWISRLGALYTTIGVKHYSYNCTNLRKVWHEKKDENTKGGKVVFMAYSLEECKEYCVSDSDGCVNGLDWNNIAPLGQQCWISTNNKLHKALELGKVSHYYLDPSLVVNEGVGKVVSEDCEWKKKENMNSPGGTMKPRVSSVEECKTQCKKAGSDKCKGIDWNPSDPIRCWLSTSDNLDIYQGVTHYTLHCPGKQTPTAASTVSTMSKPGANKCGYVKYANSSSPGGQAKSYMSDSDCRSQCSVQSACKAYQWGADSTCTFFNNDQLPQQLGTSPGSTYYIFKLCL